MSSSIPSWQILTAHAQPFRGARDLIFCLKVPLDSLLVWASSEGSGETARMRRLAWTFAARTGYKYQIRLTRSNYPWQFNTSCVELRLNGPDWIFLIFTLIKRTSVSGSGKGGPQPCSGWSPASPLSQAALHIPENSQKQNHNPLEK